MFGKNPIPWFGTEEIGREFQEITGNSGNPILRKFGKISCRKNSGVDLAEEVLNQHLLPGKFRDIHFVICNPCLACKHSNKTS